MKYYEDIAEIITTVLDSQHKVENTLVLCKENIFYPGGGGQPSDRGKFITEKISEVIDVEVINDKEWIVVKGKMEVLSGEKVKLVLDSSRRNRLSKMHTAEHLFMKSLQNMVPLARHVKNDFGEFESKVFFESPELNWDMLFEAEDQVRKIISEDRGLIIHICKKDELSRFPQLRIAKDRIKADEIRVLEIKDFDWSACKGVHLHSTKEVGSFFILGFNKDGNNWVIRFVTEPYEALFNMSEQFRMVRDYLKTSDESVLDIVKGLSVQVESYKELSREMQKRLLENPEVIKVGDIDLKIVCLGELDRTLVNESLGKGLAGNTVALVIVLKEKSSQLMIFSSAASAKAIFLHLAGKFKGKGGGSEKSAAGEVEETDKLKIVEAVRQFLNK